MTKWYGYSFGQPGKTLNYIGGGTGKYIVNLNLA